MNKLYHGFSKSSGVYKITNIENGLVYYGQAKKLQKRAIQHETALIAGAWGKVSKKGRQIKHYNEHLQADWNKYGSDAFEFEVIAVYPDETERTVAEQALIDEHYGPGCYNVRKKVSSPRKTQNHTPKPIKQPKPIGQGRKGKKNSKEWCTAMSATQKVVHAKRRERRALAAEKYRTILPVKIYSSIL